MITGVSRNDVIGLKNGSDVASPAQAISEEHQFRVMTADDVDKFGYLRPG